VEPWLAAAGSLKNIDILNALLGSFTPDQKRQFDVAFPSRVQAADGSSVPLSYEGDIPTASAKLQQFFGTCCAAVVETVSLLLISSLEGWYLHISFDTSDECPFRFLAPTVLLQLFRSSRLDAARISAFSESNIHTRSLLLRAVYSARSSNRGNHQRCLPYLRTRVKKRALKPRTWKKKIDQQRLPISIRHSFSITLLCSSRAARARTCGLLMRSFLVARGGLRRLLLNRCSVSKAIMCMQVLPVRVPR
jgi:hypothetical protein